MFRRSNRYRWRLICLVALSATTPLTVRAQAPGPAPIVAGVVQQHSYGDSRTFIGTVQPVKRAVVGSAVDGRVVECPIEEGDRVEEGQMLGQLLTETISLEVATADSELAYKMAQLEELKNGSRPEVIEQARARMAAASAHRDYLRARQNRLRELARGGGAVTQDEYEEAVAAALEAEELYLEAKSAHEEAVAGPRKELIAQAEAQVKMQQAVVARLRDQLQKHTIISRFPGYVVTKNSEVGQWVNRGDPIAEVVAIDVVEVVAQVTEQAVARLRPGAIVRAEFPALGNRVFKGEVVAAVPQGDLRARTFPVKIRIPNEITANVPLLMPGMYARVQIPLGQEQAVTFVPKDAVLIEGETKVVHVIEGAKGVGDTGRVTPQPVELGVSSGSLIEVMGELQAGQLVVTQGNELLRPGQEVQVTRLEQPQSASISAPSPSSPTESVGQRPNNPS
jgi:HlyD family secretion protein